MKGTIIKGIGGFYYIKIDNSEEIIECKARVSSDILNLPYDW